MRSFIVSGIAMMMLMVAAISSIGVTATNNYWAISCLPREKASCVNYLSLLYDNGTISSAPGDTFIDITNSTFDLLDTNAFYTAGQLAVSASMVDAAMYITDVRSRGKDQYTVRGNRSCCAAHRALALCITHMFTSLWLFLIIGFKQSNNGQVVSMTVDQTDGMLYFIVQNGNDEPQYDVHHTTIVSMPY